MATKAKKKTPTQAPSDGNPFVAFRVPAKLLRAFKAHAKAKKQPPTVLIREFMSKVTGVACD
jgi:hypothetical protein